MTSPTLFITGSEGFIGRALCKRCLALGIDYIPVDLATGTDIRRDVTHLMPEGCVVVHLAGLSSNKQCEADPALAHSVNVDGTRNLIDCAGQKHASQFILASSEWVYEGLDGPCPETRGHEIRPETLGVYGYTKYVAEAECVRLQPMRSTILRFGIVYGPRKEAGSAVESIFRDMTEVRCVRVGSRQTARRFIHVEDVVSGILASVGREGYEVFNLTGDELWTLQGVILTSARVSAVSTWISDDDPDAVPSIRDAPNTLARKALNWKPEYDLERGLRALMESVPA